MECMGLGLQCQLSTPRSQIGQIYSQDLASLVVYCNAVTREIYVCEVREDRLYLKSPAADLLLQANFAGDPQYKAHLDGPVHRKALAKAEAQRQRDLQLGASRGAAESALVCTIPGSKDRSSSRSLTMHPGSYCGLCVSDQL